MNSQEFPIIERQLIFYIVNKKHQPPKHTSRLLYFKPNVTAQNNIMKYCCLCSRLSVTWYLRDRLLISFLSHDFATISKLYISILLAWIKQRCGTRNTLIEFQGQRVTWWSLLMRRQNVTLILLPLIKRITSESWVAKFCILFYYSKYKDLCRIMSKI